PQPGTISAVCDDGKERSCIMDWEWAKHTITVTLTHTIGDQILRKGTMLRLSEKIPDHKKHETFTVSCITEEQPPRVIFEGGLAWTLCIENAACFEIQDGSRWTSLPKDAAAYSHTESFGNPGESIEVGSVVRYLGGDGQTSFGNHNTEHIAMATPAVVVTAREDHRTTLVRFEREFLGCHNNDGRYPTRQYQWIYPKYLRRYSNETLLREEGFTRLSNA
ncbi:MAG: hypothetical protein ABIG71_02880, partial [Candidatus Uhrbacteria bacterium]